MYIEFNVYGKDMNNTVCVKKAWIDIPSSYSGNYLKYPVPVSQPEMCYRQSKDNSTAFEIKNIQDIDSVLYPFFARKFGGKNVKNASLAFDDAEVAWDYSVVEDLVNKGMVISDSSGLDGEPRLILQYPIGKLPKKYAKVIRDDCIEQSDFMNLSESTPKLHKLLCDVVNMNVHNPNMLTEVKNAYNRFIVKATSAYTPDDTFFEDDYGC